MKKDADGKTVTGKKLDDPTRLGLGIIGGVGELASEGLGLWVGSFILGQPRPEFKAMCFAVRDGQFKPIFYEDPDVFYQLRFSADWEERSKSVGKMEK